MQLRNPLGFNVGFNQNLLWNTNHFSDIVSKTFLSNSDFNLIKKVQFLLNLILFVFWFLCQLIRHFSAFNFITRKKIFCDWCVMCAKEGVTTYIFEDVINRSLSDSHTVVSGSSPTQFIYYYKGWWSGLLYDTICFLKLNIKGRLS